jgi:hypothetical protein
MPLLLRTLRLLLGLFLLAGCASRLQLGESRLLRADGDPLLRSQAGPGLFVGVSRVHAEEAEARRDAELQARLSIIASLATQVESEVLQQVRLDGRPAAVLGASVEQLAQIRALSRNLIAVQAEAWYVELRERRGPDGLGSEVQAWCRMRYEPARHAALLGELLAELGPAVRERSRAAGAAFAAEELGEGLRLAGQAGRQLAVLDRYQGWTPAQQAELAELRRGREDAFRGLQLYLEIEGEPGGEVLGPALARALRARLPFVVQQGPPPPGARGLWLRTRLQLESRVLIGGLHQAQARVSCRLEQLGSGAVLWRAEEPGDSLETLREAGGSAEAARRRLLAAPQLLEILPAALAADLEAALLASP